MTLTQKILARKAGLPSVNPGDLVKARLDLTLGNDITAPVAIREMERHGLNSVFDPEKIVLVMDHFTPNKDIASAAQCASVRAFAQKHGIRHFYDVGQMGIEHVLLPELGIINPGDCIIGADSHTCTYGALGAFATGTGSTDMAAGMATGECWFRVPEGVKVTLKGRLKPPVSGKDIILYLIGKLGVDGANYMSLEFFGAEDIPMDDKLTIANMAVECGAKNGIFPVDERPDKDAVYVKEAVVGLDSLEPLVAGPHLPSNICPASELAGVRIDQALIGSCTNGRISDLRAAAAVLRGNKIAKGVRCIVVPGSQKVMLEAVREGLVETFIEAGAAVSTPTCGPCLGGHMGVLAEGEVCISTTNRNFIGRMGHVKSSVYLASPATAAISAVTGRITSPGVAK